MAEINELNKNAMGGTELMMYGLKERIDPQLYDKFQIICSRVRDINPYKRKIYWLHDLALDPEAVHLKEESSRNRFDKLVFTSNWQYQQYRDYLGLPFNSKSAVIENAIKPIDIDKKEFNGTINLIYHTTPHRGLEILVPVFEELCKIRDDIVLDVYSSFKIYGWPERDKQYEELFERCKAHPKINYHGSVSNQEVREALKKAHIFAYPSIWQETSCISVIEAMSAGCMVVHPNYGALPDTTGGLTTMYQWDDNMTIHANKFAGILNNSIDVVKQESAQNYLQFVKTYADLRFNWDKIAGQWTGLMQSLAQ